MKLSLCLVSATLFSLAAMAPAAEVLGGFVDMRLGYDTFNTGYTHRATGDAGGLNEDYDGSFDSSHRISLTWMGSLGLRSYGGWVWGIGGSYEYNAGVSYDNFDFTEQAWAFDGHLGYAIPLSQHLQVEFVPFLGFGRGYYKDSRNHDYGDAAGPRWENGVNLNGIYTFDNGLQLGLNAGLIHYKTVIDNQVLERRQEFTSRGPLGCNAMFGAFIGVRL